MAVTYRSSSSSGDADYVTSKNVPVPAGAAADDIALVGLTRWESANTAITFPAGFAELVEIVNGSTKLNVYWKRLSGADSGNYAFSWSGQQWTTGQAVLIVGGVASGNPVSAYHFAAGSSSTVPDTSVDTVNEPFLTHFVANNLPGTGTPPINFAEVQDADVLKLQYRIPATVGSHLATGGTISVSTQMCVALIAVTPAATAPIVDIGEDSWAVVDGTFGRVAVEDDVGSPIVIRVWTVESGPAQVGDIVGTDIMSTWTPTVTGSYVIRYTATNGVGSSFDEINVEVGGAVEGPQNSLMRR